MTAFTRPKSDEAIAAMRHSGQLLAQLHEHLQAECTEGVSAKQLDTIAYIFIHDHGAVPSFLGYQGFEHSTCISKNEEVVHGIPHASKIMMPGDICSIDIGIYYNGHHVDAARTWAIGDIDPQAQHLIDTTQASFFEGINAINVGDKLGVLSNAIGRYIENNNLSVVSELYGHGIGKELHEDPLVPNVGPVTKGITLKEGMTFAIEPIVSIGSPDIVTLDDRWTIISMDRSWSAHYENTILITQDGVEVLTK